MSSLLLPTSLFIKKVVNLPVSFLSEFPIYIFILFIFLTFIIRKKIIVNGLYNPKVIICIILTMFLQVLAMLFSYGDIGNHILNKNPIKEFIRLLIFIGCIYIHFIVVKLSINSNRSIQNFITGNGIALIIVLMIAYVQFLYLLSPLIFNGAVEFIGNFEKRFDRTWYDNGSYVQTMQRINGFNQESSYFAVQILVIFVPFILAAIKNKVNIFFLNAKYNSMLYYFLLINIVFVLFFAKTTTGLFAIALIVLTMCFSLPMKRRIITIFFLSISGLIGYFMVKNSPLLMTILDSYLFGKLGSGSSLNRLGGTFALIITWIKNFVTGIGWNYHNYYLLEYVPTWSTKNWEFQNVYRAEGIYPILSVFFGWLAEFGTIVVLLTVIYVYRLLKDYREISIKLNKINRDKQDIRVFEAIKDSAHYFAFFYIACSLFVFDWSESIYLIMFFFFVAIRQYYKDKLYKES